MKKILLFIIALILGILLAPDTGDNIRKDVAKIFERAKPRLASLGASFVELIDSLEGAYSDEIKANVSKKISELQKFIEKTDTTSEKGLGKIAKQVKETVKSVKGIVEGNKNKK